MTTQSWHAHYEDRPSVRRTVESRNALDAAKDFALLSPRADDCAVIVSAVAAPQETMTFDRTAGVFAPRPPGGRPRPPSPAKPARATGCLWMVAALVLLAICFSGGVYLLFPLARDLVVGALPGRPSAPRNAAEAYHLSYIESRYPQWSKVPSGLGVSALQDLALTGQPRAQNMVGNAFASGTGVPRDLTEAAKWYRKAADQGYSPAQNNLGWLYVEGGPGFAADPSEALNWLHKAADQEYAVAQSNLAEIYEKGRGVVADPARAHQWRRRAAESGYAQGQFNLGVAYQRGTGVPADPAVAADWYRKAAEQAFAPAEEALAVLYEEGTGVGKDIEEALRWRRKAAEQDHPEALYRLGLMYEQGTGVAPDKSKARELLRRAADLGNQPAAAALQRLQS